MSLVVKQRVGDRFFTCVQNDKEFNKIKSLINKKVNKYKVRSSK